MAHTRIELLAGLPPDVANRILALGSPLALASAASLFQVGEWADRLFVIERGAIALTMPMPVDGREQDVKVDERRSGEIVGWSALVPPYRYTLHARAVMASDLIAIPREALLDYLDTESRVACQLMQNVAGVIGHQLQVFQSMWLREMQQVLALRTQTSGRLV